VRLSKTAKGCSFFALLFFAGIGIMLGGLIPDMMRGPAEFHPRSEAEIDAERNTSRILEVSGLGLAFLAIYGCAGWQFARRKRDSADSPTE
jgi:hypothetical protein